MSATGTELAGMQATGGEVDVKGGMETSQSASLSAESVALGSEAPCARYGQEQHSSVTREEAEREEAFAEPLKVAAAYSVASGVEHEPAAASASFEHGEGAAEYIRAASPEGKVGTGASETHHGPPAEKQYSSAEAVELRPEVATGFSNALVGEASTWAATTGSVQTPQLASLTLHSPAGKYFVVTVATWMPVRTALDLGVYIWVAGQRERFTLPQDFNREPA